MERNKRETLGLSQNTFDNNLELLLEFMPNMNVAFNGTRLVSFHDDLVL